MPPVFCFCYQLFIFYFFFCFFLFKPQYQFDTTQITLDMLLPMWSVESQISYLSLRELQPLGYPVADFSCFCPAIQLFLLDPAINFFVIFLWFTCLQRIINVLVLNLFQSNFVHCVYYSIKLWLITISIVYRLIPVSILKFPLLA